MRITLIIAYSTIDNHKKTFLRTQLKLGFDENIVIKKAPTQGDKSWGKVPCCKGFRLGRKSGKDNQVNSYHVNSESSYNR